MGSRPPRWLKCPRKSTVINGKFIAFKTFLDDKFSSQVPLEDNFQFPMLKSYVQGNKAELGLIIDLTNTNRFYNKSVIEQNGVGYCKLACRGHGEAPSVDQTKMFIRICNTFLEKNPGKIIGVHCTHGFNRTGFLIVAYFCEIEEWSVDAAVNYFSSCRPPGIYKGQYLKDLFERYGGGPQDAPNAPELPDWCYEEEGGQDDDDGVDDQQESRPVKRRRRAYNENAKFAENLDIETVTARGAERIQEICEGMLNWDRGNFPGSQPVSMDRKNIELIHLHPYRVTWKADGTRYLMLILKQGEVYFLDRDNSVFTTDKFTFPRRKNPDEHIFDTLIDGELVMDKIGDQMHPRYLIYDIVKFEGQDVGHTDLERRLLCVEKELIKPRDEAVQSRRLDKNREPFSIRKKDFYPIEQCNWLLEKFVPKITHETDGLVLQPVLDPYTPGQCPGQLKWKPHELNSVDFLLQIVTVKQYGCLPEKVGQLFVQGYDQPFSTIKMNAELKHYDKRIIECTWDGSQWKFLRLREDKSFPNAFRTAKSVCESIQFPVTKDDLLEYINKYGYRSHGSHQHQQRR